MQNFRNRKFLLLLMLGAVLFFLRVLFPGLGGAYIAVAAVCALACFALGGGFRRRAGSILFAALILAASCLAVFYGAKTAEKNGTALSYADGRSYDVTARITEVSYTSAYASSYRVEVQDVGGKPVSFGAMLEIERGTSFEYGDIISFEAVFAELGGEEAYLRGKNIFVTATAQDAARTGEAQKGIEYYLKSANSYLCSRFVSLLGRETGGFCSALILGNRSYIGSGLRLDFARLGISHLLALSGLHLSVITQTLDFLLRGFMKKRARGALLILCAFAFALFTGLSASVLRAAVMLAFVFAADIFGEENDSITALFAAVWVILLVNGNAVYDVGFLLSASATLGIILVRPAADALFARWQVPRGRVLLRALRSAVKYFYGIFTMSTAALAFTLPVTGYVFGAFSVAGVAANFVFLPIASVLLAACVLFVPLSFVPLLGEAVGFVCDASAKLLMFLAEQFSQARGIYASLRYPFMPYLLAALAVCLFACIFVRRLTLAFAACFGVYAHACAGEMRVSIGSGRSGEYASFSAGGENYVIDISTGGYAFMRDALGSIDYFADTEVDNLVLTHYHNHHAGAIERLCDVVKIRRVLLPKPETEKETEHFTYITESLTRHGITFEVYTRGEVYVCGEVSLNFAPMRKMSRSEKPLVAFTVAYGDMTFSYVEGAALESAFDYSAYLCAQTVFVGAHGANRKFGVYADVFADAGRVIFAGGAREYFRGTEYLAEVYDTADYGGEMEILYEN